MKPQPKRRRICGYPFSPEPTERELMLRHARHDAYVEMVLRAFRIECTNTHPRTGVQCQLEPHYGECAALVNGMIVTWPGVDDSTVRGKLRNNVTRMLQHAARAGREQRPAIVRWVENQRQRRAKAAAAPQMAATDVPAPPTYPRITRLMEQHVEM